MKARRLIDGASFGPETLKVVGAAFDRAWEVIAQNFGNDPADIDRARLRLAEAMLSIAHEDSRDVEALKNGALEAMALRYSQLRNIGSTAGFAHSGTSARASRG